MLGSIYLPPENSKFYNADDYDLFANEIISKSNDHKYVFLAGDTNSRIGSLKDYIRTDPHLNELFDLDPELQSQFDKCQILENLDISLVRNSLDKRTNSHGLKLIDICKNNNLFILNGRIFSDKNTGQFTFREKSIIDYVIVTAECFNFIEHFEIIETDTLLSDGHSALSWTITIADNSINKNEHKQNGMAKRPIWKQEKEQNFVRNINTDEINSLTLELELQPDSQQTIENVTNKLKLLFENTANLTFPTGPNFHNNNSDRFDKPWFGNKCKKARDNYHNAKDEYRKNKSQNTKLRLKNASKQYKRVMNYYIKEHKHKNTETLRNLHEKSPKQYWKYINSLKPKTKNIDAPTIETLHEHFKSININTIEDDTPYNNSPEAEYQNETLNSRISENEITKCILSLKNGKAPGPSDNILNEYIKSTKDIFLPVYTRLFNCVLDTGYIPTSWVEGSIIPLYKKGNPKDAHNYRPITLLSCLGKLFTSVLNQRLTRYLDDNNILEENQAGFRKGYSCADHLFTLQSMFEILKQRKKKLFCAFIDFSQAFDKVWRIGLWHKLLQNNINGKFYTVIYNMYSNIKSYISFNGEKSLPFVSEIGVRQGENLSPALFSLYLNDLQSYMLANDSVGVELKDPTHLTVWLKLLVLLYADDTVIFSESAEDLQKSLNTFNEFCKIWHLQVNVNKTKIVVFGARNLNNFQFKINDNIIEIKDNYHYLGLTFSSNGSFLKARKHVTEQASKAMHILYTRVNNADLPIDLVLKLFDHTVLPILTYGAEIFGYENLDMIEKIHTNFLRKITKARRSTPLHFLYGELGRYPISITIKTRMISLWNRLLTAKDQNISLNIYKYLMTLPQTNLKWPNKIKEILFSVGRPDLWETQFENAHTNIDKLVKRILIDQFKQSWNEQLTVSNKGRIYKSFKNDHDFEGYFKTLEKNNYLTLFRFRTANHALPIETGRYDGTLVENRLCPLCDYNQIGSEQHYIEDCPYFDSERNEYLASTNGHLHNLTLKSVVSPDSQSAPNLKAACKFLKLIMNKFR